MKSNKVIALLLLSSTINHVQSISLRNQHKLYAAEVDETDQDQDNILQAAQKPVPVEDLSVSADEMEEYANKLHDKAGADSMFTGDDSQKLQVQAQGANPTTPTTPTTPKGAPHSLSEKNMYHAEGPHHGAGPHAKKGPHESLFVAENTRAWAMLPKDFSPTLLGGLSMNPAPPDFKHMASSDYAQLFHDAADSASKEFDRPYDVLAKESEERKKRHDAKHEGEDDFTNLPDMKDVLVQMTRADDNELMITEDQADQNKKTAKHAKKEKETKVDKISDADSMAYAETMSDQSNGVHGFMTEKKPLGGEQHEQKQQLIEQSSENFEHKKNFYEQILDVEKEKDPNAVHVLAERERAAERARNPKHQKSTFEEIQDGNAPGGLAQKKSSQDDEDTVCETCPYNQSIGLLQLKQNTVLKYFNYI